MTSLQVEQASFIDFLFRNNRNRRMLYIAGILILTQFIVFKYFYPQASFIHGDSFVYLDTAYRNLDINTYLVGYSKFIRLISVFTNSDTALVAFQYLLIQSSTWIFLFTLYYFYSPSRIVQTVLLCFMVLNPLFLHLANLISSDCYFLSLSLIWFALLLWIIHRPTSRLVILHALILFLAFTVRYNALIYPLIAVVAFWMSPLSTGRKITGIAMGFLLIGMFIFYTGSKFKSLTGSWQYSPFSGWQMANNAMYTYRYVDKMDRKPVPSKFETLDNMIRTYFDSTRDVRKYPIEGLMANTFYMWSPGLPLYKYMDLQFAKDTSASQLKKWATMGPFYREYGNYIIKQYPMFFARYFLWPNANKYYAPPVEFLESYNSGKDSVMPIAQIWFDYKSRKLSTRMKSLEIHCLNFYPILSGVINVIMLCSLICFIILRRLHKNAQIRKAVFLGSTIWLVNAAFTIFASSAALRFQSFPILLTLTYTLLLVDWIWKVGKIMEREEFKQTTAENKLIQHQIFQS